MKNFAYAGRGNSRIPTNCLTHRTYHPLLEAALLAVSTQILTKCSATDAFSAVEQWLHSVRRNKIHWKVLFSCEPKRGGSIYYCYGLRRLTQHQMVPRRDPNTGRCLGSHSTPKLPLGLQPSRTRTGTSIPPWTWQMPGGTTSRCPPAPCLQQRGNRPHGSASLFFCPRATT